MREFIRNCKRLLQIAKKPGTEEFSRVAKISGLGFLLIGVVGFIIMYIASIISGA